MNSVEVRIPANVSDELLRAIFGHGQFEPVAFGLASSARLYSGSLVLVNRIIPVPPEAHMPSNEHGARWSPRFTLDVLRQALKEQLGVVIFHAHPMDGPVKLSADDLGSARELLTRFQSVVPTRIHASVVFGTQRIDGVALLTGSDDFTPVASVRCLGEVLRDYPGRLTDERRQTQFAPELHRQVLAIGSRAQSKLRAARVAVVGLGGGGSHVVQQLAHIGVGEIIGIDDDHSDRTNRSRVVGLRWLDAILRRRKTSVMKRLVREINSAVKFTSVPHALPSAQAIEAIKSADLVVGCLDNLHARDDVHQLAWRYLIPYVDIGITIQLESGEIRNIGGNVHTFVPGDFCAWCTGFISKEKLDAETGRRGRSYLEGVAEPQVVSFNGVVASQAVNEVLELLVGFAPTPRPRFKKFDGFAGTLTGWKVRQKTDCATCRRQLAAGDLIWADATEVDGSAG